MDIKSILIEDYHHDDWYEDSEVIIVTFKKEYEDDAINFAERMPYTIIEEKESEISITVFKEDLPWTS